MTEPDTLSAPPVPAATRAQRLDGWTPDRRRTFLESVSEGHTVEAACRIVGLSVASAYALRRRADGAAFALGWRAASLLARETLADALLARAIDGHVETVTRANGDVIERHRYDNRLAATMLTRLDRLAEAGADEPTHHAARLVAQEFDAFLDLVARDAGPARAGLFLAARAPGADGVPDAADLDPIAALARADRFLRAQAGLAAEVDCADLDPAARAHWTAEQWARAEAAGLLRLAPAEPAGEPQLPQLNDDEEDDDEEALDEDADEDEDEDEEPVWCDDDGDWWTRFPPPPGFDGQAEGAFGDDDYRRTLTPAERAATEAQEKAARDDLLADETEARDRWFGFTPRPPRTAPAAHWSTEPWAADPAPESAAARPCSTLTPFQPAPNEAAPPVSPVDDEPAPVPAPPAARALEEPPTEDAPPHWREVKPWPKPSYGPGNPPPWGIPL